MRLVWAWYRAGRGRILHNRFSQVYPADVVGVLLSVQLGDGQLTPLVDFLLSALAPWYCLEESLALLRRWLGFNLSPSIMPHLPCVLTVWPEAGVYASLTSLLWNMVTVILGVGYAWSPVAISGKCAIGRSVGGLLGLSGKGHSTKQGGL